MIHRSKRLLQPASLLLYACVVLGVNLGINYALIDFKGDLQREYRVPAEEWGRFSGDVWSMQWSITSMVLIFTMIGILAAPEQGKGDRAALRRLAVQKLGQVHLTDSETQFWSRIAEEVKDDETL